jgi:hypothetical protein
MGVLTLAGLLVIYSGQVWMLLHYSPTDRPRVMFEVFAQPLWGYVVPSPWQRLGALLPKSPYSSLGEVAPIKMYYLGLVTIGLVAYAAVRREGLRRASFVWSAFALMIVLSLGASLEVGGRKLSLPAGWLYTVFPPIRMTRVICRFGIFAAVFGGVLAAAGLKPLLVSLPGAAWRALVYAGLVTVAVADLSLAGITCLRGRPPEAPGCYAFLIRHDPKGAILEIPEGHHGFLRNALFTYWQSHHRLTTSAGITGLANKDQDGQIYFSSPFFPTLIENPHYLEEPRSFSTLLVDRTDFKDYLWLYMTVNRFDYLVLHQGEVPFFGGRPPESVGRVKNLLRECKVYEDATSSVYDRARLRPPGRPVAINQGVWSQINTWAGRLSWLVPEMARVAVYNPRAGQPVRLTLDAGTARAPMSFRLWTGPREVASWLVPPGDYRTFVSAPLELPVGLSELTIESERTDGPRRGETTARKNPDGLSGLRIARLNVRQVEPEVVPVAERVPWNPSSESRRAR